MCIRDSKDTVPAMLAPGEFVMSKGAVQQYGVKALEGMNAAAGGTNKPTLMGGYNKGGFANITNTALHSQSIDSDGNTSFGIRQISPEEAKERLAAVGMPSMELFDGTVVPDFGKMGADSFMKGIQMVREGMVNHPDKIKILDDFMATNPYAQPEKLQNMINRIVPGSQEQVLGDLGDSITASAKMNGGGLVSNLSNSISNFNGGGLVSNLSNSISHFNGGGLVSNSSSNSISNFSTGGLVQAFQNGGMVASGLDFKNKQVNSVPKSPDISPPSSSSNSSVAAKITSLKMDGNNNPINLNQDEAPSEVPDFSATMMRSRDKIKTLGIMV